MVGHWLHSAWITMVIRLRKRLREGLEQPFMYWIPSIAITGMSFYEGDAFPNWQETPSWVPWLWGAPMTGHFQRITLSDEGCRWHVSRSSDLHQRIRDVRPGPDGNLYVLTDQDPGAVLRISPAE